MSAKAIDIKNKRFGRLRVLEKSTKRSSGSVMWYCLCDCGEKKLIAGYDLRRGMTKSCGCLANRKNNPTKIIHGMSKHPAYKAWQSMKKRCLNPKDTAYKDYGGRGISICKEWQMSFESFWQDMASNYHHGLTLERKDNERGYSKDNCTWATRKEQSNNRRIRSDNKTGIEGVTIMKNGRFRSRITIEGRMEHIGMSSTLEEAIIKLKEKTNDKIRN